MEQMNMQENARLVLGLRAAGWSEKKINDFILYIETGEEQYKPDSEIRAANSSGTAMRRWNRGRCEECV